MKHVAAIAIIKDGKILMGKRKDNGKWTNPGGHLNDGEDPVHGAIREVKEETGLDLQAHQLSSIGNKVVKGGKIRVYGYKADLSGTNSTTVREDPDDEVYRWIWVNIFENRNPDIFNNLHVPKDNIIMDELGIELEKKAFFIGFEKRALSIGNASKLNKMYPYKRRVKNIRLSMGSEKFPQHWS